MAENMKILLTTRNRYLEYGMRFLLKKDEVCKMASESIAVWHSNRS